MTIAAGELTGQDLISTDMFDRMTNRIAREQDMPREFAARIVDQTMAFLRACETTDRAPLGPSELVVELPARMETRTRIQTASESDNLRKNQGSELKKYGWGELPESVRSGVQKYTGTVADVELMGAGQSSNFAATLRSDSGDPVFVKGVHGVSPAMRWLRNEAEATLITSGIAPAVLFAEDIDDWLVVGFAHVAGRPAKFGVGSVDLRLVAPVLDRISDTKAPELPPLERRWQSQWWTRLAGERPTALAGWDLAVLSEWEQKVPARVSGDVLVHTDLHEDQFVITDADSVHVIDWGWPARGAEWVDPAFLVIRLVGAGHSPEEAENWARQNTRWVSASEEDVTAFAVYVAGLWTYKAATTDSVARLARDYAAWRLRSTL